MRRSPLEIVLALLASVLIVGTALDTQAKPEEKPAQASGSIVVPVTNLQNVEKGQLLVILYKKVKRVEVNGVPHFRRLIRPVSGNKVTVTFEDIPYGDYAVAVMHDMDKDLEMATNWLGIPNEDLGVSNNVKGGPLGGPKWNAAKFSHQSAENRISAIEMWQCYD